MNTLSPSVKGMLLVSLGTTLFSSKSILIQLAYQVGATVDQLMLIRMLVALPCYLLMGFWAWGRLTDKPDIKTLFLIALPGFGCYHIASYLDMWALQFLSAGLERVLLFSYPIIVIGLSALQGSRLTGAQWFGVLVAYVGVGLFFMGDIYVHEQVSLLAAAAVLVAALFTAFYMRASQTYGKRYSSDLFTAVAMGITGLTIPSHYMALHGVNLGVSLANISAEIWVYGIVLSLVMTVLASVVLNRGIGLVGASRGSVVGMLGPMVTLLVAAWLLGQSITSLHILAVFITVLGVAMVTNKWNPLQRILSDKG
jgi:drug/metabolite transporter (DMT)-like permease